MATSTEKTDLGLINNAVILLATYNGASFLREQLDSLYRQVGISVKVIARDDGSSDGTVDILREYGEKFGLILVSDDYAGGSGAKNFRRLLLTLDPAAHSVFLFADQDDIWMSDKVSKAASKVSQGVDLYSSALHTFTTDTSVVRPLKSEVRPTKYDHLFQGLSAGCTYAMSSMLVRSLVRVLSDPWFETNDFSHDWLVYTVARSEGMQIFHDSEASIFYRQHAGNVQGAAAGASGIAYRLRNIGVGWYEGQIIKNKDLCQADSEELKIVEAFERGEWWSLIKNAMHLRRSLVESFVVVLFSVLRRRVSND